MGSECGWIFYVVGCGGWGRMQKVLTKYWLTIHVGLMLFCPWFYLAQPRVQGLTPLLWLSLIAIEVAVLLPSVRRGETFADARMRVIRATVKDTLFYIGSAVLVFATIQWLNSGCKLMYLPDADIWQFTDPVVPWAPFSVEAKTSLTNVSVFAACIAGSLCLRHAVSQTGKRYLLQTAMLLSGALAVYSVWQACHSVEPYVGYAFGREWCALGAFFGFWLILGMGVFVEALAREQRGVEVFFALGVVGNLVGMLFFSKAFSMVLYAVIAFLLFFYWMAYLNTHVPKHVQLKLFFVSVVVLVSVTVALTYVFPGNPVEGKIKGLLPLEHSWHALAETREIRMNAALKIWQDHPWVGVGADGFHHFVGSVIGDKDWRLIKADQACVYNDSLQLLCEYGLLGLGLLLSAVITLMVPVCHRARIAWKCGGRDENDSRIFLLRISPLVLTGVLATGICFLESWFGSPFRSPSVLVSWVFILSVVPDFLPASTRTAP